MRSSIYYDRNIELDEDKAKSTQTCVILVRGHACWALRNNAPNLASAALATTLCMIWQRMSMGPLSGGRVLAAVGGVVGMVLRKW